MESHIRINISANFIALQNLRPSVYKTLICLAQHADSCGRCFPSAETIAYECNLHVQTVYAALKELLTYGYIKILESTYFNPITGKKSPTVWQVSPDFLSIADKFIEFAKNLWNNIAHGDIKAIPDINQQQNYVPETIPGNQYQKQQQQTQNENRQPPKTKPPTAKNEAPTPLATNNAQRHTLPTENRPIVKFYTNPESVKIPLENEIHERLVKRLAEWGMKAHFARGLIVEYGFAKCYAAADYTEHCIAYQEIERPAGFYRSIVQNDLIGSYVESRYGQSHNNFYDDQLEM